MQRVLLILITALAIACAGCGPKEDAKTGPAQQAPVESPSTPDAQLAEQLRAGSVSLSGMLNTLEDAEKEVTALRGKAKPDEKAALDEIADFIASSADAAAEYAASPPAEEEVAKSFAKFDEQRLTAITELNDALVDLTSARGTAVVLAEADSAYDQLASLLELAEQDLQDGITALGGKVEPPAEEEQSP